MAQNDNPPQQQNGDACAAGLADRASVIDGWQQASQQQSSDVVLRGARQIGAVVGLDEKQTFRLLRTGALTSPKRVGGRWYVSKQRLLREFGA